MKRFFSILLVALTQWSLMAASWYVDNTVANSGNGTSWASAWKQFSNINWSSVNPGDTLQISGGANGQTYGGMLKIPKSGTAAAPIRVTVGQDGTHSGTVTFDGQIGSDFSYVDMNGINYIVFDGEYQGQRRFRLVNLVDTGNAQYGNKIFAQNTVGNKWRYLTFDNVNNCLNITYSSGFVIEYCVGTNVRGDCAVKAVNSPDNGWDSHFVQNCSFGIAYCTNAAFAGFLGPDGVQGSHGLTIRNNVFYIQGVSYQTSRQHPDYTQVIGNHTKIYGNEFIDIGDSGNDMDWWVNDSPHDIWIFNNVYRLTANGIAHRLRTKAFDPYPEYIRFYTSQNPFKSLTGWKVMNNTFIDSNWATILMNFGSGNAVLSGIDIKNNIFVNTGVYSLAPGNANFSNDKMGLGHNVYAGGSWSWNGKTYNPNSWAEVEPSRIVGLPEFTRYTPYAKDNDLHLLSVDTVATAAGLDLSAYFNTDKDGIVRTNWDCGAYANTGRTNSVPPDGGGGGDGGTTNLPPVVITGPVTNVWTSTSTTTTVGTNVTYGGKSTNVTVEVQTR
jgi:hypothetical protein